MTAQPLSELYYASNLGNGVTVRIVTRNHQTVVEIRHSTLNTTPHKHPTDSGISLSPQNWARLILLKTLYQILKG